MGEIFHSVHCGREGMRDGTPAQGPDRGAARPRSRRALARENGAEVLVVARRLS